MGKFDTGAYVHLLFAPDDLRETGARGFRSVQELGRELERRLALGMAALSDRPDYQLGLTIVVHGGLGRGFHLRLPVAPSSWRVVALPLHDFMLLAGDSEMSAIRAWKLLDYEAQLLDADVRFVNGGGFPNWYGFAAETGFELVPENLDEGSVGLSLGFAGLVRERLRHALDRHAVAGPEDRSWIEVQRDSTALFLDGLHHPIFTSIGSLLQNKVLVCVETPNRPWWVVCGVPVQDERWRDFVFLVCEMVSNWLLRLAPELEARLADLPAGPVSYYLEFPNIRGLTDEALLDGTAPEEPFVEVRRRSVRVVCTRKYVRSFVGRRNVGDRFMVSGLTRGAYALAGTSAPEEVLAEIVDGIVRSDDARFVHFPVARSARQRIEAQLRFPAVRKVSQEDLAWSRLGLAGAVERGIRPGPLSEETARSFLNGAVDSVWRRIRSRLETLDRASTIERLLENFAAVCKERSAWSVAAAALRVTLADSSQAFSSWSGTEREAHLAGLCSRVAAEMALCTCPTASGLTCSNVHVDVLIAEVAVLLECANHSDAIRHGLASTMPVVQGNGALRFVDTFEEQVARFFETRRSEAFYDAVKSYGHTSFEDEELDELPPGFPAAFKAECHLSVDQYLEFVERCGADALEHGRIGRWLRRSVVLRRLREVGVEEPERAFRAFVLRPRRRWDEKRPTGASPRDWYPWKSDRRLSIMRRPLVQCDTSAEPRVYVMPTLLENTSQYLLSAAKGDRAAELFDSARMRTWIGSESDRSGHEFNKEVGERLRDLDWCVRVELRMSELGARTGLGDVDVLAWRPSSGRVFVIECKRLKFDRSVGDFGERLIEFGESGPLEKHRRRVAWLVDHGQQVADLTGLPLGRLEIKSAVVTRGLTPLQFSDRLHETLDLVCDYASLGREFGGP